MLPRARGLHPGVRYQKGDIAMLPRSAKPVVFLMVLLAVVAASVPAWGQSWAGQGRLQGLLRDEAGKPIQGATITLRKGTGRVDPKTDGPDRKSTRLNSSHMSISYAVFCLKKKKEKQNEKSSNSERQH